MSTTDCVVLNMEETGNKLLELLKPVDQGNKTVLLKNKQPSYVVMAYTEYEELRRRLFEAALDEENLDSLQAYLNLARYNDEIE